MRKRTLTYTITLETDLPREVVEHELELTLNDLVDSDEDREIVAESSNGSRRVVTSEE